MGHYADMGLLGVATPSDYGGLDGGAADLLPVMNAFGRALVVEPLLASAVLGATALGLSSAAALRDKLLPRMAAGEHRRARFGRPRPRPRRGQAAGRQARPLGRRAAVQLHGGIGMTDEYVVGHALQRLAVIDTLLGNQDVQLDRLVLLVPGDGD